MYSLFQVCTNFFVLISHNGHSNEHYLNGSNEFLYQHALQTNIQGEMKMKYTKCTFTSLIYEQILSLITLQQKIPTIEIYLKKGKIISLSKTTRNSTEVIV